MIKKLIAITLVVVLFSTSLYALDNISLGLPEDQINNYMMYMEKAVEEFNASGVVNKYGNPIKTDVSYIDETIFKNYGLLTMKYSYTTDGNDFNGGVPRILGTSPSGMPAINPLYPPDELTDGFKIDRLMYVGNRTEEDIEKMKSHSKIGEDIPDILPFKSKTLLESNPILYMELVEGMIEGYAKKDNNGNIIKKYYTSEFENKRNIAKTHYETTGDPSKYYDVKVYNTNKMAYVGLEEVAIITVLPTDFGYGQALFFHTNGSWYADIKIMPHSRFDNGSISVMGEIIAPSTIESSVASVDARLDFEINSSIELASYEITSANTNIDLITPVTQGIGGSNYKESIPFVIDTSAGLNPNTVEFTIEATDIEGNTREILVSKNIYVSYKTDFSGSESSVIGADERGAEQFDVTKGIPSSEELYVNVFGDEYLTAYTYIPVNHYKEYTVPVTKVYYKKWLEDSGRRTVKGGIIYDQKTGKDTVRTNVTVTRTYAYYLLQQLDVYGLQSATVSNGALKDGQVVIEPKGYVPPTVDASHAPQTTAHITEPVITPVELSVELDGGFKEPATPKEDFTTVASDSVDEIMVKNDKLVFNGIVLMDDSVHEKSAPTPKPIPDAPKTHENVFYKKDLKIPENRENEVYGSNGFITYNRIKSINSVGGDTINRMIVGINDVLVHTPVFCDGGIQSLKSFNQEINSDPSRASLILGKSTVVRVLTEGQHLNIRGYGHRDYEKYTAVKQVRFPFDVYFDTTYRETDKYVRANTWVDVPMDRDWYNVYLPIWVREGNYEINYRAVAINNGDDSVEGTANLDRVHYIATDSSPVRVIGRLYGLKVTDISDHDTWNQVFREGNTEVHSANYYYVGMKDENGDLRGNTKGYTLPLMNGSHPDFKHYGALKTGYSVMFELNTIGQYEKEKDCVAIYPTFYFVNKDGSGRQPVDLYYSEYFNDKTNYFVKIDKSFNRKNTKFIQMGDIYRNVAVEEVENTSRILGMTASEFRNTDSKIGWFDFTVLSKPVRTFVGETNNLPEGVDGDRVLQSKQKWYGEYYLPNDVYAVPKDYDVLDYGRTHNGLDGKENFWLKEGYIVVNFNIQTVKNGAFDHPILSYEEGEDGNMWAIEGYELLKSDDDGNGFGLEYGDVLFYYGDRKASDDYKDYGTH